MERYPNFFIVGAARCGTTSLYHYLNGSSDVFMSKIKEPHFFASNFCKLINYNTVTNKEEYLKLFENVTTEQAVGEASVHYFQATEAAGDISPQIVARGIKVALLTTVAGLIVGVILQLFYNYLVSKIDSMVNDMEDASISLVDMLVQHKLSK